MNLLSFSCCFPHVCSAVLGCQQGSISTMQWFCSGEPDTTTTAMVLYSDNEEAVEWVNMCWRKV